METIEIDGNIYSPRAFECIRKLYKTCNPDLIEDFQKEYGKDTVFNMAVSPHGMDIPDRYALYNFEVVMCGHNINVHFKTEREAKEKYCEILEKVKNYVCE